MEFVRVVDAENVVGANDLIASANHCWLLMSPNVSDRSDSRRKTTYNFCLNIAQVHIDVNEHLSDDSSDDWTLFVGGMPVRVSLCQSIKDVISVIPSDFHCNPLVRVDDPGEQV